jgi:hypothetical protein
VDEPGRSAARHAGRGPADRAGRGLARHAGRGSKAERGRAILSLAAALNVLAGLVMPERSVGKRPFFAAGYPMAAAVSWGAARGVRAGVAAGLALGVSLAAGQLANGVDLGAEDADALRHPARPGPVVIGLAPRTPGTSAAATCERRTT